jgi:hypothetical protein
MRARVARLRAWQQREQLWPYRSGSLAGWFYTSCRERDSREHGRRAGAMPRAALRQANR